MLQIDPALLFWLMVTLKIGSLYLCIRVIGFVAVTVTEIFNAYQIKKQNHTLDTIIKQAKAGQSEKEGIYTGRGSSKDN